jgi:hypothetical protein
MKSVVCLSVDLLILVQNLLTDLDLLNCCLCCYFVSQIYNEICLLVGLFFSHKKKHSSLVYYYHGCRTGE